MINPTVVRISQQNTFSQNGVLSLSYLVTFSVGANGPFTVQIPAAEFTAQNVKAAMQKVADQINQLGVGA